MKRILTVFLATIMFVSCGVTKKTTKKKETSKNTEKTKESKKDSTSTLTETLPTESELVYDLNDLSKNVGDFIQKMNAGNGNETEIKKEGSKIYIKNKTGGSKESKTKIVKEEKEFVYDSEYIYQESKTLIRRIPFKYWIYLILILIFYNRKKIISLISFFFPVIKGWKIISFILGTREKT